MDLILHNPLSKNNKGNVQTHKLVRHYKKNNIPFRLKSIVKISDMKEFLEEKQQYEKIILLGGDGTINRFVNNTFDYDIKQDIYLKKNGSGNDYLRSLKGNDKSPQYIMKASYDTGQKTHYINSIGMGLDGYVIYLTNKSVRKGQLRYFFNTLKGLIKYIPEPLTLDIDNVEFNFKKAYLVVMSNGKYFGGGMKVAPDGNVNDENLDVLVLHSAKKILILPIFIALYFGKHRMFKKYVFFKKGKHIKATYSSPQISQADGETFHDVTSIDTMSSKKQIHLKYFN